MNRRWSRLAVRCRLRPTRYRALYNIPDPECVMGDVNNDGMIDVTDIIRAVNIIVNSGFPATDEGICAADLNGDGSVDILDILVIVNLILGE